jgi:predicted PurR-regulated permease PerM
MAVAVGLVLAWVMFTYIGTFIFGLFLYYVTLPAHRRLRTRFRPTVAATAALLGLAVPVVVLTGYTLAVATQELTTLREATDLGPLADQLEPYLDVSAAIRDPVALLQRPEAVDIGQAFAQSALRYIPVVGTALIHVFVALAVAFYLLRDGRRFNAWFRDSFGGEQGLLDTYLRAVDTDLESVYFGNILNAFAIAIVAVFCYTLLNLVAPTEGIPYPALIAVLAGAASLIPVVGMKIVYIPITIGLFARAVVGGDPLWFPTAFLVVTVVFVDFIPDLVLRPYVSGRNLHVGLVMIAYILGPLLFGWSGLFLGPFLLVVVYHFIRLVFPALLNGDDIGTMFAADESATTVDSEPADSENVDSDPT